MLNDDGNFYKKTYYHVKNRVCFHGDLAILTARKSLRILARSDTLLNVKGIQEAAVLECQQEDGETFMVCFLVMISRWTLNSEGIT